MLIFAHMYIPKEFEITDKAEIHAFLTEHPFGLLITAGTNEHAEITHLPYLLELDVHGNYLLEGHLARINSHARVLEESSISKFVVNGAAGYVSSSVYSHVNVPTYNYQAVHLTGKVEVLDDIQLLNHLKKVVNQFEKPRTEPLDFEAWPKEMISSYLKEIMGFRLHISNVEAAFKLSQNRNEVDFHAIVTDLQAKDSKSKELAEAMIKTRLK